MKQTFNLFLAAFVALGHVVMLQAAPLKSIERDLRELEENRRQAIKQGT
jgi:hypothetical protein